LNTEVCYHHSQGTVTLAKLYRQKCLCGQ